LKINQSPAGLINHGGAFCRFEPEYPFLSAEIISQSGDACLAGFGMGAEDRAVDKNAERF
jgi:hypothetical protein